MVMALDTALSPESWPSPTAWVKVKDPSSAVKTYSMVMTTALAWPERVGRGSRMRRSLTLVWR
jgi:hypothetical protein